VFLPSNLVTSDFLPGRPKTTGENETEAKPAMIIDLHIHPYCREVSLKPGIEEAVCRMYGEKWDKAGLQRMTSQFKALFLERGVKDIIADMDASNIGRACIVALDLTTKYNVEMVDNDDVGKLASMHPDRFIPFASVDPSMGRAAVDKLARAVEEYGCKGLKLAPSLQGFDFSDSKHSPLWETALDLDIVVWSHTAHQAPFAGSDARLSHPMLLEPVAIRYPDLKIVLGHCGFPWAMEAWSLVVRHPNVHIDISRFIKLYDQFPWDAFFKENAAHKIHFATDYPLLGFKDTLEALHRVDMLPEIRNKILHENTAALLEI
jgi:predicted TIM-barrel fold metal-dependent hydrolase